LLLLSIVVFVCFVVRSRFRPLFAEAAQNRYTFKRDSAG